MRILIDGRPAQYRPRGMGIYVKKIVQALLAASAPFELIVALDQRFGEDPWKDLARLQRVWGEAGNISTWEQKVLPKLALQAHADLLHCVANSAPRQCKIPLVVTIHDAIFMRPFREAITAFKIRPLLGHWYYKWTIPKIAKQARQIITVSQASAVDLHKKLNLSRGKITVIPNGPPVISNPQPESVLKRILEDLKLAKPYVAAFGALDARKNIDNLLRAFARLPRAAAESLVLLGFERVEETIIPNLINQLNLNDRVHILGYLPEETVSAVMQAAAAFAYPSKSEGFGFPLLQAFSLGVPVITTRIGSIPEVASDAVRYADPDDPQSIAAGLLDVLVDPNEAHRLAIAGYLQAKKFSWETAAHQTIKVYEHVLKVKK